ncbi:MAG TPA: hypothetical protein VMZ90_14800 [Vicinamibacterales bacterium]|nr:hypothetical protein [Vicinamibacterales bacterium]
MTRQLTAAILSGVLITTIACGKSAEQKQAEENAKAVSEAAKAATDATKTGADQMAAGAAAMAKGFEAMARGTANVEVVPFETLGAALPEVSGWTRGEVTGSQQSIPKVSMSKAEYRNGDKQIRLEVMDAALAQMMFIPFTAFLSANYSERSSEGYKKGTTVRGEPAFEDVNTKDERAELTVVVGKRFIVSAHGNRGTSIENVRALVEQVDFGKLTAAK